MTQSINDDAETRGHEPETMEALLAQQAVQSQKLAGKQVTWVKVISVTADSVLVDIGEKREGVIPLADFVGEADPKKKAKDKDKEKGEETRLPTAGQRVPVILIGAGRDGITKLSHKRARAELGWEAAVKAHAEKQRVRGQVVSSIKGGFLVDVNGVMGFLPASLADLRPVRNPARMLHTGVRCYILELNESKKQIVLSRKAVLEEEAGKRKTEMLNGLRVGEIKIGRIVNVTPQAVTIDIGGVEGVVRPADLSWNAAKPPKLERGDKLRVKVLSKPAAATEGKPGAEPVYLGIKQLTPNPADALKRKYAAKSTVHGKVLEAGPNGVRLELDDKSIAFSPAAECDPATTYKAGEKISAIVLFVNFTTFEVTVSINKYDEIKDRKRLAQYLKAPPPLTLGQLLQQDKE
jgi:small subunit ribosomal protein S1